MLCMFADAAVLGVAGMCINRPIRSPKQDIFAAPSGGQTMVALSRHRLFRAAGRDIARAHGL
jgi:hypothetical protein